MPGFVVSIFFGWPAILGSVIVSCVGLLRSNYRWLAASAFLAFGPCWFLSGFPVVNSPIFLAPLLLFGAAYLLFRGHEMLPWFLVLPYYFLVFLLYSVILAQV